MRSPFIENARAAVALLSFAAVAAEPCEVAAWPPPVPLTVPDDQRDTRFPTPAALEPAVAFWREMFVRHDSHQMVLHDREEMDLIWQVIDLPVDKKGEVDEKSAGALVRQSVEDLRARLRRLARDPTPSDDLDVIILASIGASDRSRLRDASCRVRAQRGVADKFREGLVHSDRWLPSVQRILAEEDVPLELVALPFVESMFNPRARSAAGAAGVWQLMPATARGLGLTVQQGDDQRFDVLIATRAAARMLRESYQVLGSWPLALTAYNHGPSGVRRAVKQTGSSDLGHLIEHYRKSTWGFASKNFYAEFLAVLQVLRGHPELSAKLAQARVSL